MVCVKWVQYCTKPGGTAGSFSHDPVPAELLGQDRFFVFPSSRAYKYTCFIKEEEKQS